MEGPGEGKNVGDERGGEGGEVGLLRGRNERGVSELGERTDERTGAYGSELTRMRFVWRV